MQRKSLDLTVSFVLFALRIRDFLLDGGIPVNYAPADLDQITRVGPSRTLNLAVNGYE